MGGPTGLCQHLILDEQYRYHWTSMIDKVTRKHIGEQGGYRTSGEWVQNAKGHEHCNNLATVRTFHTHMNVCDSCAQEMNDNMDKADPILDGSRELCYSCGDLRVAQVSVETKTGIYHYCKRLTCADIGRFHLANKKIKLTSTPVQIYYIREVLKNEKNRKNSRWVKGFFI